MRIITKMRVQQAAYWARGAVDSHGVYSYAEPVLIKCRWDDATEEFRDKKGQTCYSSAVVYPDRAMGIGDCLLLTNELPETSDPKSVKGLEIQAFNKIPTLNGKQTLYIAYL